MSPQGLTFGSIGFQNQNKNATMTKKSLYSIGDQFGGKIPHFCSMPKGYLRLCCEFETHLDGTQTKGNIVPEVGFRLDDITAWQYERENNAIALL